MTKMKKGFTLIELMVVIVIIGILAAIAIPKLFGMTAKAKASEVGPAAGSWSKLQQAYISEKSAAGSFARIGYTPPGATTSITSTGATSHFRYESNLVSTDVTAETADDTQTGLVIFTATNIGNMGDCKTADGDWTAQVDASSATATATPPSNAVCATLTPNFRTLR